MKIHSKEIFFLIITLLFAINMQSQTVHQAKSYSLNDNSLNVSGNHIYKGRDYIKLLPGFTYNATNSNSVDLKIDDLVTSSMDQNYLSTTGEATINSRNLDMNLAVGSTSGGINVSLNGAATYNIPIILPPGTCGLVPSLSVAYNSNGGDGIMGEGWKINGLSAIYRTSKSLEPDGIIQEVQFNENDAFSLDGNRLVAGSSTGEYRISDETFVKLTVLSSNAYGPSSFKAETKEGLIIEYGVTDDSKLMHSANADKIFVYYINKVSDRNGNYYTYTYTNNRTNGEFRIQKIEYTSNDDANITAYNSVYFIYEIKPNENIYTEYDLGSLITKNVLLREIRIKAEGNLFHKYVFNYTNNTSNNHKFIRLTDIQEFGENDIAYNKTLFNWGTGTSPSFTVNNGVLNNPDLPFYYDQPFFGDFNGDGKIERADINRIRNQNNYTLWDYNVQIYRGFTGNSTTELATGVADDDSKYYLSKPNSYATAGTADINGDGKDDALYVEDHVWTSPVGRSYSFTALLSDGYSFTKNTKKGFSSEFFVFITSAS